jgi:ribosomal protein S18 acetylase RimI-like enzyme
MHLKIRKANIKDIQQVNKIAKQVHDLHVAFRPDIYVSNAIIFSNEDFEKVLHQGIILVGELDQTICSYAICFIKKYTIPLVEKRNVLFIDAIGNEQSYKHFGIGKKMMDYICVFAKEAGCHSMELQVNALNIEAIGFL